MMDKKDKDKLIYGLIGLLIVALFSLFTSCRARIRYIPIETVRTDSLFETLFELIVYLFMTQLLLH